MAQIWGGGRQIGADGPAGALVAPLISGRGGRMPQQLTVRTPGGFYT
jgi:hypothetical protein